MSSLFWWFIPGLIGGIIFWSVLAWWLL